MLMLIFAYIQLLGIDSGSLPKVTEFVSSEKVRHAAIEIALHDFETFAEGEYYFYNLVELNHDNNLDAVVYVIGRDVCGSGGCRLFVLGGNSKGFKVVAELKNNYIPIVVSTKLTNGWNDLILWQRSYAWDKANRIGYPSYYACLAFDGHTYPPEQAKPLLEPTAGIAYLANPAKPEFGVPIKRGKGLSTSLP